MMEERFGFIMPKTYEMEVYGSIRMKNLWTIKGIGRGVRRFQMAVRRLLLHHEGRIVAIRVIGAFSLELDGEICEVKRVTYLSP